MDREYLKKIQKMMNMRNCFFPNKEMREEMTTEVLKDAFVYHYSKNETYRKYCDSICEYDEIIKNVNKIPALPSTLFKKEAIMSCMEEEVVKMCYSSGTSGSTSTIYRDKLTMEMFFLGLKSAVREILENKDYYVLNLGPSTDEANIWFSYVMSEIKRIFPEQNYVKQGIFECEKLYSDIQQNLSKKNLAIVGAPIMFMNFMEYLEREKLVIQNAENICIITGGGWKKNVNISLDSKQFFEKLSVFFVGINRQNVRDFFNMVELNSVLPSCECGSKHIPVWMDAYVIDLDSYEIADQGKSGLLTFLDSTAVSFPGFIVSGDLGTVIYEDNCPCGRKGKCIKIERRINTIESRGCALKLQSSFDKIK